MKSKKERGYYIGRFTSYKVSSKKYNKLSQQELDILEKRLIYKHYKYNIEDSNDVYNLYLKKRDKKLQEITEAKEKLENQIKENKKDRRLFQLAIDAGITNIENDDGRESLLIKYDKILLGKVEIMYNHLGIAVLKASIRGAEQRRIKNIEDKKERKKERKAIKNGMIAVVKKKIDFYKLEL